MASNYPPGVSGNEPQITGIWPAEQLVSHALETVNKFKEGLDELASLLDDQGALTVNLDSAFNRAGGQLEDIRLGVERLLPPEYDG